MGMNLDLPRLLAEGLVWGLSIWTAYAALEFLLYTVFPLYTQPEMVISPLAWRVQTLLLNCYWVVGILGGSSGAVLAGTLSRGRTNTADVARLGASLSLLAVAAYNLGFDSNPGLSVTSVVVGNLVLIAATFHAIRKPGGRLARWICIHPLLLAWPLVGPIWLAKEILQEQSQPLK